MKNTKKLLITALLSIISSAAFADMTVDKTNGVLTISSDIEGTVIVKVIAPDDEVVVDVSYSGNSFSWSPSSGPDGAYRYDVRVIAKAATSNNNEGARLVLYKASNESSKESQQTGTNSDYVGGSVDVRNGQLSNNEEMVQ